MQEKEDVNLTMSAKLKHLLDCCTYQEHLKGYQRAMGKKWTSKDFG